MYSGSFDRHMFHVAGKSVFHVRRALGEKQHHIIRRKAHSMRCQVTVMSLLYA